MTPAAPSPAPPPLRTVPESLLDRERLNPWLFWVIHIGLPMVVSLLFHFSIFVALGLTTWQVLSEGNDREYSASLKATGGDPFSTQFQWPGQETLEDFQPEPVPRLESLSDLRELSRTSDLAVAAPTQIGDAGGFGLGERGPLGLLGTGGGAPESGSGGGVGAGLGERPGIGRAGVWSVEVAANRVCYVVDFSGSTIGAIDDLKRELKRSVGNLGGEQQFNVFVFYSKQDRYITESFKPRLMAADSENKRDFFAWLDAQTPDGHTDPLKAMERALKLNPEAVFLFSDGYFDDPKAEEKIAAMNRKVRATIHCLVFDDILLENFSDLAQTTEGARRMKKVAEQNNGKMKIVTGKDLAGG